MARQIVTGIDIGTSQTKVIIAEGFFDNNHFLPRIIGTGTAESKGLSRGYITNPSEAAISIKAAVARAEKTAGIKVRQAYVSFGGAGLSSITADGSIVISRPDMEITERDLALVLEAAELAIPKEHSVNRKVINTIPIEYRIDGKVVMGQALGLKAQKLEAKALFITCLEHHLRDLIQAAEEAGIGVIDVVAGPVAASFVTLSKRQKRVGALLADFGAETTSIVVFENGNLLSLAVFPIGGADITNDIALGFKISLEEAENVKVGHTGRTTLPKKKYDDLVSSKMKIAFENINQHLKSIGRDGLLPAGVVMTGGGAALSGIKTFAENSLKLPSQIGEINFSSKEGRRISSNVWSVACGLSIVGFNTDEEQHMIGSKNGGISAENGKRWFKKILKAITQFLP